ncbi:lamin tail domain-containing protein [Subtercola boreus]|uniref:LTD domain-containing protein n=1 Tax=Subtercola boreus TaxID=120213 RepID=A0A3E0W8A8_9MICO|nr:lamin tail domain-containing protein [Subtercola boreus]RFA18271.1 hypothetical protein B7R23_14595 [Subtercola boreus]RFA18663.1 hypothetical protein B7R24_14555 [Subtercola boreus]RFA25266.1 hypothetical protein B7R25_14590 [Subtercola boreus]
MAVTWRLPAGAVLAAAVLTASFIAPQAATAAGAPAAIEPQAAAVVKINEVESSGGTPGDWVELTNTGPVDADVSGFIVKDSDDTHSFVIAGGTSIAPGGYYAADVDPSFGLGSSDSARLFTPDGTTLVDSYSWTSHAATTYGRCPDGTGAFTTTSSSTKGAVNDCGTTAPPTGPAAEAWPGGASVATADPNGVLGGNLSGLAYDPSGTAAPGTLWAVKNGPSTLYKLTYNGTTWAPDASSDWAGGKALRYPDGTGDPDTEGVTFTAAGPDGGAYVSTERNNSANTVSRPEVLKFDTAATGTTLSATMEWNLTADLPAVAPNSGLEAISWISDAFLVSKGFIDEKTGAAYSPSTYADHGDGLFFVGLEANGTIYAYALNQVTGGYTRVATIASGFTGVMDLEFEPETGNFWAECDDTCNGRSATLAIADSGATQGRFAVTHVYERPTGMPNYNNEGFAIAPQTQCVSGLKPVYWSDDTNDDGNALRSGTIACTPLPVQTVPVGVLSLKPLGVASTIAPGGTVTGLGAKLVDRAGTPAGGERITFRITGPATFAGGALAANVVTGADGVALTPTIAAGNVGRVVVSAVRGGSSTVSLPVITVVKSAASVTATVTAATSSVDQKVTLTVSATNTSAVPVTIQLKTAYGTKTQVKVAPGATVTQAFPTRLTKIASGSATVVVTSPAGQRTFAAPYAAATAG